MSAWCVHVHACVPMCGYVLSKDGGKSSGSSQGLPVASWVDEVETAVDPVVFNVPPVQA